MTKWKDDDWERKQKARNPKLSNHSIKLKPEQMYRNLTPREIIRSEQEEIWEYRKMGEDIDSF